MVCLPDQEGIPEVCHWFLLSDKGICPFSMYNQLAFAVICSLSSWLIMICKLDVIEILFAKAYIIIAAVSNSNY